MCRTCHARSPSSPPKMPCATDATPTSWMVGLYNSRFRETKGRLFHANRPTTAAPPRRSLPAKSQSDPRLREQPPLGASILNITRGPPRPMICECEIFLPRRGRVLKAAEPNARLPHQAMPRNFPARPGAQGRAGDKGSDTPGCQDRKVPGGRLAFPGRTGPPPTQWTRPEPFLAKEPFSLQAASAPRAQGWHVVMRLALGKPRVPGRGWVLCREAAPRCRRPETHPRWDGAELSGLF